MNRERNASFCGLLWNIFGVYGIKWFWVIIILTVFKVLSLATLAGAESIPMLSVSLSWLGKFPVLDQAVSANPGLRIFMVLVFAPFIEEAVFRMLPLTIVQLVKKPEFTRAVIIVICGIVFGIAHGHPLNVFIQGVGGMLLGYLYLMNARSQLSSYISCVFVHAAYNFTVLMSVVLATKGG